MVTKLQADAQDTVFLAKVRNEDFIGPLAGAIKALGGIELNRDASVLIKPNLCTFMGPETGATTDVRLVEALIQLFNDLEPTCRIAVVESKSQSGEAPDKFRRLGYEVLEKKYDNVRLVNLDDQRLYALDENIYDEQIRIPEIFLESNYFVSVAKLKTSDQQRISCVFKNQFGCIPGRKEKYHPWLSQVIVDVNHALTPDLCIIDGVFAMEGRGPTSGKSKRMDLLIVGKNPVATDTVAAQLMGIKPENVPHLKEAAKRGMGRMDPIRMEGENLGNVAENFRAIPSYVFALFRLESFFQRMGSQIRRSGVLMHIMGAFLYDSRSYLSVLRELSIPQIRQYVKLFQQE